MTYQEKCELQKDIEAKELRYSSLIAYNQDCCQFLSILCNDATYTSIPNVRTPFERLEAVKYYQREIDKSSKDIYFLGENIRMLRNILERESHRY